MLYAVHYNMICKVNVDLHTIVIHTAKGDGLVYKVFWLPPRYSVLKSYVLLLAILLVLLLITLVFKAYLRICKR